MVGPLVIDFDGDSPPVILQDEVGIATILINIVKMILSIEVSVVLRAVDLA